MKDYIIPTRLYYRMAAKADIKHQSREFLPVPYDHRVLIVEARTKGGHSDRSFREPHKRLNQRNTPIIDFYDHNYSYFVGFEAAALYGFDILQDFHQVDEYVYRGMEQLTNQQFDHFSDLSQQIGEYQHSFWTGMSDPGINKIAGHIGEVYAADHLEALGASVEWPDVSNQVGWDLLVNGHEMNVKLVSDYSSLSEHFAKYPDIPVIVPSDMDNIPDTALFLNTTDGIDQMMAALGSGQEHLVIVDSALSHVAVVSQTEQATDVLLGSQDVISAQVPILTLLFSGWREASLLRKGKTEISSALKNVGLDAAGTGFGGVAGAKAGALIGTTLGPLGTAAGALIGGVGGAIFGRFLTNKVKHASYNSAIASYTVEAEQLNVRVKDETTAFTEHIIQMTAVKQEDMRRFGEAERVRLRKEFESVVEQRQMDLAMSVDSAISIVQAALDEMSALQLNLRTTIQESGWFRRVFLPSKSQLAMELAIKRLQAATKSLQRYQLSLNQQTAVNRNELYTILAGYGVQYAQIADEMLTCEDNRMKREETLRTQISNRQARIIEERVASLGGLSASIVLMKQEVQFKLNPAMAYVKELADKVRTEANKLGLKG